MTRLPVMLASTILEERRHERATLTRRRLARDGRADRRRLQKLAKEHARDERLSLNLQPAEPDVIIDLTDHAAASEPKEYARS